MNPKMQTARDELGTLLEKHELTKGMYVRTHGDHLIVGRREIFDSETIEGDRVRLTKLSSNRYGLSVKRHNGRWERTPFSPNSSVISVVVEDDHEQCLSSSRMRSC